MWPEPYWAPIRMRNPKTHEIKEYWISFILPHEVIDKIASVSDLNAMSDLSNADPITKSFVEEQRTLTGNPHLIGVGLWGDEVPCFWDRAESISALTINFPGLTGEGAKIRILLCSINHAYWCEHTWHDVLQVVAWSFSWLDHGRNPPHRHDRRPWFEDGSRWLVDKARARKAGSRLSAKAILAECRGDWKFFAEAYGMPLWNSGQGICWDCICKKEEARHFTL